MSHSFPLRVFLILAACCGVSRAESRERAATVASSLPNIVVIFVDDLGYADIGPFGGSSATPNLDRMAKEGRVFTDFIVPSAVCSASRAGLLTGCIPERVSIRGALGPDAVHGIAASEVTLAEICKSREYATACFGKWHLGHQPRFLPVRHGFDEYFGLPYSNDMWPQHPTLAGLSETERRKRYPPLPLLQQDQVVDANVTAEKQSELTKLYSEASVDFIRRHRDQPFFLYLAHTMVHVPIFASPNFEGKSSLGLYADVVMEVDASVGMILDALEEVGVDERTLVIFTSDNGPWLSYGDHAGSAGPLREGKGTAWEGGVRVPTVMRMPGFIPADTRCAELASTIDLLPTVAKLIGAKLPDHPIDGKDITALLNDADAQSPHESYPYYFADGQLQAIRDRRWKLVFPHQYRTLQGSEAGKDGRPVPYRQVQAELSLYDLENDVGETTNVYEQHPEIASRLQQAAEDWRSKLGDSLSKCTGSEVRPHDRLMDTDARLTW